LTKVATAEDEHFVGKLSLTPENKVTEVVTTLHKGDKSSSMGPRN